jgi:hypothetical protein
MRSFKPRTLLVLVFCALVPSPSMSQSCYGVCFNGSDSIRDHSCVDSPQGSIVYYVRDCDCPMCRPPSPPHSLGAWASCDLTRGEIRVRTAGCNKGWGEVTTFARDLFRLSGPDAADLVSFQAVLSVTGTASRLETAGGYWTISAHETPMVQWPHLDLDGPVSSELTLPLACRSGESFPLFYSVYVGSGGNGGAANVVVSFVFRGLPPGYSITSCAGYSTPTGIAATSWAHVKELYR